MSIATLLLSASALASTGGDLAIPDFALFGADSPTPPPIVDGQPTSAFKAVGALVAVNNAGNDYFEFCSGTLVDDKAVITAAHCIESIFEYIDYGYPYFLFVVGTDVYAEGGVDRAGDRPPRLQPPLAGPRHRRAEALRRAAGRGPGAGGGLPRR